MYKSEWNEGHLSNNMVSQILVAIYLILSYIPE